MISVASAQSGIGVGGGVGGSIWSFRNPNNWHSTLQSDLDVSGTVKREVLQNRDKNLSPNDNDMNPTPDGLDADDSGDFCDDKSPNSRRNGNAVATRLEYDGVMETNEDECSSGGAMCESSPEVKTEFFGRGTQDAKENSSVEDETGNAELSVQFKSRSSPPQVQDNRSVPRSWFTGALPGSSPMPRKLSPRHQLLIRYQNEQNEEIERSKRVLLQQQLQQQQQQQPYIDEDGESVSSSGFINDQRSSDEESSNDFQAISCKPEPNLQHHHPQQQQQQQHHHHSELFENIGADGHATTEVLPCHLCDYKAISKSEYNDHMKRVHFTFRCSSCVYSARTPGRLNRHMRDFHSNSGNAGCKKPRRPRKYSCKQCAYTTLVQEDMWSHTRVHVPASKLLSCPRCPFVCAFKHHMQYHLNNHFNYKPFGCHLCKYRCNNKSMLNSHFKSHSNDYPFRCEHCPYAAKYRHALNQHASKNQHYPSVPLDTIPEQEPPVLHPQQMLQNEEPEEVDGFRVRSVKNGWKNQAGKGQMRSRLRTYPRDRNQEMSDFRWFDDRRVEMHSMGIRRAVDIRRQSESDVLLNQQPMELGASVGGTDEGIPHAGERNHLFAEQLNRKQQNQQQPPLLPISQIPRRELQEFNAYQSEPPFLTPVYPQSGSFETSSSISPHRLRSPILPELIDESVSKLEKLRTSNPSNYFLTPPRKQFTTPTSADNCASIPTKSPSTGETPLDLRAKSREEGQSEAGRGGANSGSPVDGAYDCVHCGIVFADRILSALHKKYHGTPDPFQCNLCGKQTKNRVEFFIHTCTVAHPVLDGALSDQL